MIDEKLNRLIIGLDAKGYKKHGRATALQKQTGYAVSTISEVLKGTSDLTERFAKIVCSAAGLSFEWVWEQKGEMLADTEKERPLTIAEQIGPGYGPEVKLMADYLEVKIKGKTAEERLKIVEEIMEQIRSKYK
jgi:hypothetical protein